MWCRGRRRTSGCAAALRCVWFGKSRDVLGCQVPEISHPENRAAAATGARKCGETAQLVPEGGSIVSDGASNITGRAVSRRRWHRMSRPRKRVGPEPRESWALMPTFGLRLRQ